MATLTQTEERTAAAKTGGGEVRVRPLFAAWMMCWREIVRFFRQRGRVIGALGQPVLFWVLFGAGLGRSFRLGSGDAGFSDYYFPGTMMLIVLFTAIFATISIIEDRREGFLQSVLVSPLPRWSMVLGKVLGGTWIAVLEGLIFLLLGLTIGMYQGVLPALLAMVYLLLAAFGVTAMGVVLAWRSDSVQGFHAVMSVLLFPMWLLSGAFFPVPALDAEAHAAEWIMHALMRVNPMTYGVAGLQHYLLPKAMLSGLRSEEYWMPSLAVSWLVTGLFAAVMFALACHAAGRRTQGDLL